MPYHPKDSTSRRPPRYFDRWEQDSADVRQLCLECRQLTTKRHICNPLCRKCESCFCPGSGTCDGFCGSYPCCGCCNETQTDLTATDVARMPLESHEQQNTEIRFPNLLVIMFQLINFIFSEKEPQLSFERGIYRSAITALGGRDAFANMLHNTIEEYPGLLPFVGGAYTDDNMNVIPAKNTRRGQKLGKSRKRRIEDLDPGSHKHPRALTGEDSNHRTE